MAKFEGVEASRKLEADGWIGEVEQEALEMLGEDALDFDHPELSDHGVIFWDADEMARLHKETGQLGSLDSEHLAEVIEMNMPKTFLRQATVPLSGSLAVRTVLDVNGPKKMLIADVLLRKPLSQERLSLIKTVGRVSGAELPLRSPRARIKLATVHTRVPIEPKQFKKLEAKMPPSVQTIRGIIVPKRFDVQETTAAT